MKPRQSNQNVIKSTCILLLLYFHQVAANSSGGRSREPPSIKCIVCNTQQDPICREDDTGATPPRGNATMNTTSGHLDPFMRTCPPRKSFCYKSEGRIVTVNYTGHPQIIWKVDRGCAKAYSKNTCARVLQEDETDFRVCYCNGTEYCNRNRTVFGRGVDVRNPNGVGKVEGGLVMPVVFLLVGGLIG